VAVAALVLLSTVAPAPVVAADRPSQLVEDPFAERTLRKVAPQADAFSEPSGPYGVVEAYAVEGGERRVVAPTAERADALSTAAFVMADGAAATTLERTGAGGRFVQADGAPIRTRSWLAHAVE
jgi:hypothetical protein